MTDYQPCKTTYDRDGFVIVRQFLTPQEVAELQGNLDRYIRDVVLTVPDSHAFYQERGKLATLKQLQFMEKVDPFFRDYCNHPKWVALGEALLGESIATKTPSWFNKPPGIGHPTPPHQDNAYAFYVPCYHAMIWLALDVVDDENGCLHYVKCSNHGGLRPHGVSNVLGFSKGITDFNAQDEANEVKVHLQPGDAVAHNGMTIHRAAPNRSAHRQRRAFAMAMTGVSVKVDEVAAARHKANVKAQHEKLGLKV
ncbi:MAG: phytanoyl-CoA dioxygenase [Acidobacteria bacterium]|nr:MAG: phytanoyl-CoA dioxygenase [Acidobacteriota bacterium]